MSFQIHDILFMENKMKRNAVLNHPSFDIPLSYWAFLQTVTEDNFESKALIGNRISIPSLFKGPTFQIFIYQWISTGRSSPSTVHAPFLKRLPFTHLHDVQEWTVFSCKFQAQHILSCVVPDQLAYRPGLINMYKETVHARLNSHYFCFRSCVD